MKVRDAVKCYLPSGNHARGWVEAVEPRRVGVRLVGGNFRWCRPADVTPDRPAHAADRWGYEDRG